MGWRAVVALGVVAGCATGCADKSAEAEANARSVAPGSTADATAPVVDEGNRFRLASPGSGWKLLGRADASKLLPQAAAAAMGPNGVAAVVVVRPAAATPLAEYVASVIDCLRLTQVEVEKNEEATVQGHQARYFVVKGDADGVPLRYAGLVLAPKGRLVRLMAWGSQSDTTADGAWFQPVREAFSLLDGEIAAADLAAVAPPAVGAGWRVADGRYESVAGAVRVRPPAGFRLLVGAELALVDPEAEVGLVQPTLGLTLVVRSEPIPSERRPGLLGAMAEQLQQRWKLADPPAREEAELAGQSGVLLRYETKQEARAQGLACAQDRCIEGTARHPAQAGAAVEQAMMAGWRSIELLSGAERAELAGGWADADGLQDRVGADYVVRGDVYRNFAARVAWTKPKGWWRIVTGPAAALAHRDAALYLREPARGLQGLLLVEQAQGTKLADYHGAVTARMTALSGFAPGPAEPSTVGDVEAMVSEGDGGPEGRRVRYRVLTAIDGGRAVQVLVWGWPENVAAHASAVKAVADGVELRGVAPPTERRGNVYRDVRMGYELQPPVDWDQQDVTPPELRPTGSFVRWSRDGRWLAVVALGVHEPSQDGRWFVGLLEQLLRDEVGPLSRGPVARAEEQLAGQSAQRVSWSAWLQRVDALVLRRGGVIYAVVTVDKDGESAALARERFVLLP